MTSINFVLIDFYANWCGPCQTIRPIVEDISLYYSDKIKIIDIDVDTNASLARNFSIQSVPTLILYKGEKEVWRHSGLITKNELTKTLDKYLKNFI